MAKEYAKKLYKSKAWKQCRESYISKVNHLCERCYKNNIIKPGYIVHHKTYITPQNINNPMITLNHENLEYVCLDCHNREHFDIEITRDDVEFDNEGNLIKR